MVRRMVKLHIATVLLLAIAGCAHRAGPALKDSGGWPYPTWAQMDGLICYDAAHERYVSARALRGDLRGQDVRCGYGAVNRGVQYDQPVRQHDATPPAIVTRQPSLPFPSAPGAAVAR